MVTVQNDVQEIHLQVVDHLSPKKKSAQRSGGERALGLIEKELCVVWGLSRAGKKDRSEKEPSRKRYPGASLWTYEDFGSTCWVI